MTEPPNDAATGGSGVASTTNEESVANTVAFDHANHGVLVTGGGEVEVCHRSSTPEGW